MRSRASASQARRNAALNADPVLFPNVQTISVGEARADYDARLRARKNNVAAGLGWTNTPLTAPPPRQGVFPNVQTPTVNVQPGRGMPLIGNVQGIPGPMPVNQDRVPMYRPEVLRSAPYVNTVAGKPGQNQPYYGRDARDHAPSHSPKRDAAQRRASYLDAKRRGRKGSRVALNPDMAPMNNRAYNRLKSDLSPAARKLMPRQSMLGAGAKRAAKHVKAHKIGYSAGAAAAITVGGIMRHGRSADKTVGRPTGMYGY